MSKSILKNTLYLYIRMILVLLVSLYTSRIILKTLGFTDFGIYNVVAGIVTMVSFLNTSFARGTQRFLIVEIVKKDESLLNNTFNTTLSIHALLAIFLGIIAAPLGYYIIYYILNLPIERIDVAWFVYQTTIFSFLIGIIQIPYTALLIAHEEMSIYAYIGVFEAVLKLITVFLLQFIEYDNLTTYAILTSFSSFTILIIHILFCKRYFPYCKYSFFLNKIKAKEIFLFSGWSMLPHFAAIFSGQGINMLINIYFSPTMNTTRAIALQASGALNSFVANFQTASGPQIMKRYASNDIEGENKLIILTCKLSLFLIFFFALPCFLEYNYLLTLWLENIPEKSGIFFQLIIIDLVVVTSALPMFQAIMATGNIKQHQLSSTLLHIIYFFLCFFLLDIGFAVETIFVLAIIQQILMLIIRVILIKKIIKFPVLFYIKEVVVRGFSVLFFSCMIPTYIFFILQESFLRVVLITLASTLSLIITIYVLGLSLEEKVMCNEKIKNFLRKNNA